MRSGKLIGISPRRSWDTCRLLGCRDILLKRICLSKFHLSRNGSTELVTKYNRDHYVASREPFTKFREISNVLTVLPGVSVKAHFRVVPLTTLSNLLTLSDD